MARKWGDRYQAGGLADRLCALLTARARLRNRVTGRLLVGTGLGLAVARKP